MRRASAKPKRTALEQHLCSLSGHHGEAERRVGVRTASEKAALGTARLSLAKSHLLVVSSTDVRRTESASAEPLRSTRRIVAAVESCASGSSPQQPPARGSASLARRHQAAVRRTLRTPSIGSCPKLVDAEARGCGLMRRVSSPLEANLCLGDQSAMRFALQSNSAGYAEAGRPWGCSWSSAIRLRPARSILPVGLSGISSRKMISSGAL